MDEYIRVAPNSRISKFPRILWPLLFFMRRIFSHWIGRLPMNPNRYPFHFDSVAVGNNTDFMNTSEFKEAYSALVSSYGWDPGLPWRVHQVMWAVDQTRKLGGDWIEFGVGRGGLMSAALKHHGAWNESSKKLYLFDTFLPYRLDGEGKQSSNSPAFEYYSEGLEATQRNFAEYTNVEFHVGDIFETLPSFEIPSLALVSIDLNAARVEEFVLRNIYSRVLPGGVIILDDYAAARREIQRITFDKLSRELGFSILRTPSGQGIVIKS